MRRQFLHPQFIIDDDGQLVVIISTIGFSSGLEICESVIVILLAGKGILFLISLALLPVLDPVVVRWGAHWYLLFNFTRCCGKVEVGNQNNFYRLR